MILFGDLHTNRNTIFLVHLIDDKIAPLSFYVFFYLLCSGKNKVQCLAVEDIHKAHLKIQLYK